MSNTSGFVDASNRVTLPDDLPKVEAGWGSRGDAVVSGRSAAFAGSHTVSELYQLYQLHVSQNSGSTLKILVAKPRT